MGGGLWVTGAALQCMGCLPKHSKCARVFSYNYTQCVDKQSGLEKELQSNIKDFAICNSKTTHK